MNILIIGSEGFIGRHCVAYYLKKGYSVTGCDLTDYPSQPYHYLKISRLQPGFEVAFKNGNIYNICINAAGNGSVPVSIEKPLLDFESNCSDVLRLLEDLRVNNPNCKYLHISSAAVYGNPLHIPVNENNELSPISPYGWHKLISENICSEYHKLYSIPTAVIRPFSVYGVGLRKQLFWDLFQKAKGVKEVKLWGSGNETRDFIYIDDVVKAIDCVIEKSEMESNVYNVASGKSISIKGAANIFLDKLCPGITINFSLKNRAGDPANWQADISNLINIGFHPDVDFESGITKTVKWLKDSALA